VPEAPCAEKLRLSKAVVKAVEVVYNVKTPEGKMKARAAEREAVKALDEHRKQHGC
jgi:hypothetical protein